MTIAEMLEAQNSDEGAQEPPKGIFESFETYLATIHSYTAPQASWLANSHIVETDSALVIFDVPSSLSFAQQFRDYVDSLGKPVDRIYISDDHIDQWLGLSLFPEVPAYTFQQIIDKVAESRPALEQLRQEEFGQLAFDTKINIQQLRVHSDIVDGLTYEFELLEKAQSQWQLMIWLPEISVVLAQGLLSNNVHSSLAQPDLQSWIRNLAVFSVDAKDHHIFVGHGYPAQVDVSQISKQIEYIQTMGRIFKTSHNLSNEETAAAIQSAYPSYEGKALADLSAAYYQDTLKVSD